ncbi:Protein root UVB sensitive 3 [Gracilariopsis chorda]|uniref:Protein root UVB sensitive 3 n=1 Tax=Gracilariopsis chorda TaxID=448386 RepID=A0A2V3J2M4_9FLOR|nr:Protein root UVB sensitive 3 [Gracilariopsis chorda]|eukprot:PXF48624.1 Protein root UVB sensitive 3 [Gracilariopsis chorda]
MPICFASPFTNLPFHLKYRAATAKRREYRCKFFQSADPNPASSPRPASTSARKKHPLQTSSEPTIIEHSKDSAYQLDLRTATLQHVVLRDSSKRSTATLNPIRNILASLLPTGYPATVQPGYLYWTIWHIGRHIFRQSYYVLGTTSLLSSLGLSTSKSLAVGVTVKWVLKDGIGMGTKFLLSTSLARLVDADPKRFRMLGDTMMACSALVEILSILNPRYFLVFGTIAGLLREAGGAMSGPAYRVFLDSFAGNNNIGDVSSRGEAQVVIGNLLGLGLGVMIRHQLDALQGGIRLFGTVSAFVPLAGMHLFCTRNAVGTVRLRTLNWQRVNTVIDAYLSDETIPDVETVNRLERLLPFGKARALRKRIVLGASLKEFEHVADQMVEMLQEQCKNVIVVYDGSVVGLLIGVDADVQDMFFGLMWARKLVALVHTKETAEQKQMVRESLEWTREHHHVVMKLLNLRGWSTEKLLIPTETPRYRVSPDGQ